MDVHLGALFVPLLVAVAAVAVLLLDTFLPKRFALVSVWVALGAVVLAFLVSLGFVTSGAQAFCRTGGPRPACAYDLAPYGAALHLVLLYGAAVVLLLSVPSLTARQQPPGEYAFLLLASVTGALVLTAAGDLATLVAGLETTTLPVLALLALRRDSRGAEAALKLFLVSIASTAVLLFGASWVYAVRGSLWFADLAAAGSSTAVAPELRPVLAAGVVLCVAGLGFKVAVVPFHGWLPDTYAGAPVPVATYLAVVAKVAGFAGLVVLLGHGLAGAAAAWAPVLAVVAALTMTVGNLAALRARSAVRLLAWSSVAQAGYVLAPFGAAPGAGSEAYGGPVTYLVAYAVMNLLVFAVVVAVAREAPAGRLASYRGLLWRRPLLGASLVLGLVALAGLPPALVGLFAKVVVLHAVVVGGTPWLAVVVAVNLVLGLAYYLPWAVTVVLRPERGRPAPDAARVPVTAGTGGSRPLRSPRPAPRLPAVTADEAADVDRALRAHTPLPVPLTVAVAVSAAAVVLLSAVPQVFAGVRELVTFPFP